MNVKGTRTNLYCVWKCLLRGFGVQMVIEKMQNFIHSTPSTSGGGMPSSWCREESIKALPRMRLSDSLPNSWLVASPSSEPLLLAKAEARSFTCATAPEWKPPSVSKANGRKTRPSRRQASAVSLVFLIQAFVREAPASAAAPATFELASGLVTVTSIAPSFPFDQRLITTSPGRAMVPGSRCLSSFTGPRSALAAASKITSYSVLDCSNLVRESVMCWLIGPKLFRPEAYHPVCASSKLCEFISLNNVL